MPDNPELKPKEVMIKPLINSDDDGLPPDLIKGKKAQDENLPHFDPDPTTSPRDLTLDNSTPVKAPKS